MVLPTGALSLSLPLLISASIYLDTRMSIHTHTLTNAQIPVPEIEQHKDECLGKPKQAILSRKSKSKSLHVLVDEDQSSNLGKGSQGFKLPAIPWATSSNPNSAGPPRTGIVPLSRQGTAGRAREVTASHRLAALFVCVEERNIFGFASVCVYGCTHGCMLALSARSLVFGCAGLPTVIEDTHNDSVDITSPPKTRATDYSRATTAFPQTAGSQDHPQKN